LVIAALLHDAIEDQEVPSDLIAREFGKRVADVVKQVTDDKSLAKEERKKRQIASAPSWSVKRRLEYIGWAREVVAGLRGASPWLEQQFDHAAAEAEGSVAVRRASSKV